MAYENDILTRNDNDELAVRTVQSVGDNPASSYDDVYTRDNNGKLAVRVVGTGGGGGSDPHNLGWYATQSALETAHPTAEDGDWAIVGSTDTVWVWDSDTNAWKDTDQKGQVESVNSKTGAVVLNASDVGALENTATGLNSVTIEGTVATSDQATNVGKNSQAGYRATATGQWANANANYGTAYGFGSVANQQYATSVGTGATCTGANGTATGANATAGNNSTSVGYFARATGTNCIQLGSNGTSAVTNSDNNTMKVANANGNFEMMSADGTIPTDRLVHAINKYSTMPTAASTNEGWIVQFTGTTDSAYTHGHLYECVSDGGNPATYSWTEVSMGGGSGLPSQTGNAGKFLTTDGTDASWGSEIINKAVILTGVSTNMSAALILRTSNVNNGAQFYYNNGTNRVELLSGTTNPATGSGRTLAVGKLNPIGNQQTLGDAGQWNRWLKTYTQNLNSGNTNAGDIIVPDVGGTMAVIQVNTTITLAAADWSSNTQTVSVNGVTSTSVVFVAPDPADTTDYVSAGILCTSQGTNSLTFTATTTPSTDIDVVVVAM